MVSATTALSKRVYSAATEPETEALNLKSPSHLTPRSRHDFLEGSWARLLRDRH
jgi:hypothetical protein